VTTAMTETDARAAVAAAVRRVVPDADMDDLDDDEPVREAFELDSLDFLTFVEVLGERSGRRIEESDYARLTTMADCVAFLRAPAA
jgi:acyl carrier protein